MYISFTDLIVGVIPLILFIILFLLTWYRRYKADGMIKNIIIIPEFNPGNLKFYEVGALVDREITNKDIVALAVYYYLNPGEVKDQIEKDIYEKYCNKEGLMNIKKYLLGEEKNNDVKFKSGFTSGLCSKLIKDKFFVYNPFALRLGAFGTGSLPFAFTALFNKILSLPPFLKDITLSSFVIGSFIALFAFEFHERLDRVIEVRKKILGYKMFLKTTDYYKVKKDKATYEKYMPYFILFGYYKNEGDDMLEYCLSKVN